MLKRIVFAAGGLTLLSVLFFGRDAASYMRTSAGRVKDTVRESVPIEFEIERARREVQNLVPDIRKNMHVIAKEEVEVEQLEGQIARLQEQLTGDESDLVRLRADLTSSKTTYRYAGRNYTEDQVKADLSRRFQRFQTNDATLASLKEIHHARELSLGAAQQKLEGMLAAKRQLEVDVENLEAKLKMVEVAQTTSDYKFDDSRLARVKALVSDIRTRLDVAGKLANADTQYLDEIPLETDTPSDIVDQVTEYLQGRAPATPIELADRAL
jgi:peptidoglycan hydrolase CwlO-like protein